MSPTSDPTLSFTPASWPAFALGNLLRYQDKSEEAGKHFDIALQLLERYPPDEVLPESEDLSAARLQVIIRNGAARKEHAA